MFLINTIIIVSTRKFVNMLCILNIVQFLNNHWNNNFEKPIKTRFYGCRKRDLRHFGHYYLFLYIQILNEMMLFVVTLQGFFLTFFNVFYCLYTLGLLTFLLTWNGSKVKTSCFYDGLEIEDPIPTYHLVKLLLGACY